MAKQDLPMLIRKTLKHKSECNVKINLTRILSVLLVSRLVYGSYSSITYFDNNEYAPNTDCSTTVAADPNGNAYVPDMNYSTTVAADHDGLDCRAFLKDYRNGQIDEMERNIGWSKSYVTRSITPKPFYWSTHHPELDNVRKTSFEFGDYYERNLSKLIIKTFDAKTAEGSKEAIFLDVGGNIGWFSLLAAAHGATKVYLFEPNPANVVRVCESLSMNDWLREDRSKDLFVTIPKGVGNVTGVQSLYRLYERNPGSFTFSKKIAGKKSDAVGEIELITLDSFAENQGWFDEKPSIAFFKLDVEGYELHIVDGAQKLFNSQIIELFSIEMKANKPDAEKSKIIDIVFNSGYELYMHGSFRGPNIIVKKKYASYEELLQDIIANTYYENLIFRKKEWKGGNITSTSRI